MVNEKRIVLLKHKHQPARASLQAFRTTCTNNYWLKLCKRISLSFDTGDIRGMKEVTSITICNTAPLKSRAGEIIKDSDKQMLTYRAGEIINDTDKEMERCVERGALLGTVFQRKQVMDQLGPLPFPGELNKFCSG